MRLESSSNGTVVTSRGYPQPVEDLAGTGGLLPWTSTTSARNWRC